MIEGLKYAVEVCKRAAARHGVYASEDESGFGSGVNWSKQIAQKEACLGIVKLLQKKISMSQKHTEIEQERCSTCLWLIDGRCKTKKGCERYSGWEPKGNKK